MVRAVLLATALLGAVPSNARSPAWLKALVSTPLPARDDKANAVLLLSETVLTVRPNGEISRLERKAFRILRPDGRDRGVVRVDYDTQSHVTSLQGWSMPADGKDYEVGLAQSIESAVIGVDGSELIDDSRTRLLRIPASNPGSLIGYEYEVRERPYVISDEWNIQETIPGVEARYTLQLPAGWTYRATWSGQAAVAPEATGPGQWRWTVRDLKPVRVEANMPPWRAVGSRMFVGLVRPNGKAESFETWRDLGNWYLDLVKDRRAASPAIRAKVTELTAGLQSPFEKMQALARFVQQDIRYVAIELGIGGHQPHPASDVFSKRYGDCKDKSTLLGAMLNEIGIPSYYVVINTQRGYVTEQTPPNLGFNHAIIAIQLPADLKDVRLQSVVSHPKLGRLLFFDPTDAFVPLGRVAGTLQSNSALLVGPEGGELVTVPRMPTDASAIRRSAKLTLDALGGLQGTVDESRVGDRAADQRSQFLAATQETDRIKPVETVLARSFANFKLVNATSANLREQDLPFEWHYGVQVQNYAKLAGDLLLVRPRVLGSKSEGFLETKEPRENAIVFEEAHRDTDDFVVETPAGYVPDSLPPPVNADFGFAAYQSRTEVSGNKLHYHRVFEIRDLIVPVSKAEKLKEFYRIVEGDERAVAVLKRAGT
jgi:hypothetical protein